MVQILSANRRAENRASGLLHCTSRLLARPGRRNKCVRFVGKTGRFAEVQPPLTQLYGPAVRRKRVGLIYTSTGGPMAYSRLSPDACRKKAWDCLALAEQFTDPEHKAAMPRFAGWWMQLAEHDRRVIAIAVSCSTPSPPCALTRARKHRHPEADLAGKVLSEIEAGGDA